MEQLLENEEDYKAIKAISKAEFGEEWMEHFEEAQKMFFGSPHPSGLTRGQRFGRRKEGAKESKRTRSFPEFITKYLP